MEHFFDWAANNVWVWPIIWFLIIFIVLSVAFAILGLLGDILGWLFGRGKWLLIIVILIIAGIYIYLYWDKIFS